MTRVLLFILSIIAAITQVQSFATSGMNHARGGLNGGSTFVIAQRFQIIHTSRPSTSLSMGSSAKFGIFSPAVYVAKIVLGQDKLNKIRGKAISLHSEAIGDFCLWAGAYHLRTKLIKKAKTNGDTLGFLV